MTGFTLLGAAVIAGIAVANDAFRRLPDGGLHTAPGVHHAKATIAAVMAAPLIVVITAGYLPWLDRFPPPLRAVLFGATAAGLGWVVLSMATRPIKELEAIAAGANVLEDVTAVTLPPRSVGGLLSFDVHKDEPFDLDRLGRRTLVENFCGEVTDAAAPMLWALDGPWGSGKSAFVRMSEAHLRNNGTAVVVFTPPVEGLTGTPLTDLVAAVSGQLAPQPRARRDDPIPDGLRSLWTHGKALGDPRLLLGDFASQGTNPAARLTTARRLLAEHVERSQQRLVVWIDELDRCEPRYALAMLQSARTLLHVPNVVTVVAVNRRALCHSVDTIHGEGAADRFLDRYIDRTIPLTPPGDGAYERHQLVEGLVQAWVKTLGADRWAPDALLWSTLATVGVATDLNTRDIAQIVAEFALIVPQLPPVESYEKQLPARVRTRPQESVQAAQQRRAETNLVLLGLLVLRRHSAREYASIAEHVDKYGPTPDNWPALADNVGRALRVNDWPKSIGDGGIMMALQHVSQRTPATAPTLADLIRIVHGQPSEPSSPVLE